MWLEGDWNIVQGAFFDAWVGARRLRCLPSRSPAFWTRFRAFDWGYAAASFSSWLVAVVIRTTILQRASPAARRSAALSGYGTARRGRGRPEPVGGHGSGGVDRGPGGWQLFSAAGDSRSCRERRTIDRGADAQGRRPFPATAIAGSAALGRIERLGSRCGRGIKGDGAAAPMFLPCSTPAGTSSAPCRFCSTTRRGQRTSLTAAEDHIADETRYACLSRPLIAPPPPPSPRRSSGWGANRANDRATIGAGTRCRPSGRGGEQSQTGGIVDGRARQNSARGSEAGHGHHQQERRVRRSCSGRWDRPWFPRPSLEVVKVWPT